MADKVDYVQLDWGAWWEDRDFRDNMTPALRGVYWSWVLDYYREGGPIPDNPEALRKVANWHKENWLEAYETVKKKFLEKDGKLHHKRCNREIREATKRRNEKRRAGLQGAKKRWQRHSTANSTANGGAIAKVSKGKVSKEEPPIVPLPKPNGTDPKTVDQAFEGPPRFQTDGIPEYSPKQLAALGAMKAAYMVAFPPRSPPTPWYERMAKEAAAQGDDFADRITGQSLVAWNHHRLSAGQECYCGNYINWLLDPVRERRAGTSPNLPAGLQESLSRANGILRNVPTKEREELRRRAQEEPKEGVSEWIRMAELKEGEV